MTDLQISTDEAKQNKLFYVVANVIVVNPDDATCLLLKRSESEKVHPGKWAYPGGKLEHADVIKLLKKTGNNSLKGIDNIMGKLAARECKEECGLTVNEDGAIVKNKVFVRPDGVPVFMVVMTAEYTGSEEVVIEEGAFSDYAWVSTEQLPNYELIEGTEVEITAALKRYDSQGLV